MVPATTSLIGFSGEIKWPWGQITLLVKIGDDEHSMSAWMDFMVVRSTSPHNGIIRRPGLRKIQAVPSTAHRMIKFPVIGGILTLKGSKIIPVECADIAEHRLNVRKCCQPVWQKKRGQAAERNVAINDEVSKLVAAGIMREVHYHDWLSNPVMDGYPLPEIDWKVESLCGFPFKCFLDEYKGYHQIQMAEEDEEKTAFITNQGIFCYTKMPFGLRNVGATYQQLVDKTFHRQIGRNLKEQHSYILPMLTALEEQEELIVYVAASKEAVSVVLMIEREARQMSIYFVIRALRGPEVNYTAMEKLVLALVHASKRLRRYFQAHPIIVITDQPIKNILSNPEVAGRMQKWSIQLGEEESQDIPQRKKNAPAQWTCSLTVIFVDGSLSRVILTDPEGIEFTYALRFQFEATNNEAEYEALIAGLRIAEKMGVQNLEVKVDSKLVANQVNRIYVAKETDMIKYLEKVKALASTFRAFSIKQVPRSKNKKADALSKMASTSFAHLSKQVLVEELKEKSVNESEVLAVVEEEGDSWMTPIHEYLTDETLPAERKKARAIKRKSRRFAIINGILYKKSFLGPWLRCVGPLQANYVLREIHEGSCSMHAGTRSVVAKALRTGYYWPTMHKDARALIKACQECQVHKPIPRNPQERLNPITSPWTAEVDIAENDEALEINLDLIEEKREQAAIREAKSKRQMEKYYNTKVRNTSFKTSETYCIQGGNEQPCRNPGKKKFGT
ncbi:reverse transcriptase domain-containing protein [Tanacetum coccineum]